MVTILISKVASKAATFPYRWNMKIIRTLSDYSTNGGLVVGVWVFARHGDRTPSRSLCPPEWKEHESMFWRTKLPTPDPVSVLKTFSENFPLDIHPSNQGKFIDVNRRPYGYLTYLGMEQLQTSGRRFAIRYDRHGHHCKREDGDLVKSFLDSWDVQAFSTNYLRTVLSVQCFLDGLLATSTYTPCFKDRILLEDIDALYVPDHSDFSHPKDGMVSIGVRDKTIDKLNAFDRNPALIKHLVTQVVTSPDFIKTDSQAAPLAARLANYLPGLMRENRHTFGGPSGINWIEATDHFVCRRSHAIPFCKFSQFEGDHEAERTLEAMEQNTLAHRTWRFRQWYQSPPLLAEIATPALRDILEQMQATPGLGNQERHPFVLYGCHDVTILALLYAIGAEFLADENNARWRFWPGYGTTLVFELVQITDDLGAITHVVRVLLNGVPVKSVNLLKNSNSSPTEYLGKAPLNLLSLENFEQLITDLEVAGGMPHTFFEAEGDSIPSGSVIKGETG
jgi:Histidine phosphatase superfamily (branch 2)